MKIGEAHWTQASSLYSANTIGAPMHPAPIGVADRKRKKKYWLTVLGQHCLLAEGDIGAPIYWRTELSAAPFLLADRTQKMYRNVRILSRLDKKNKKRLTEQFRALRLFSSQSPINLALQTGNGNTLQRRWRAQKKINRHRSPRSGTLFYQ